VNELKEIYWSEEELKKGLNKMIKHVSAFELADGDPNQFLFGT
jgi:hypothetical protein